jgi:hypothetical protein
MGPVQLISATGQFVLETHEWHGYFEAINLDGALLLASVTVGAERPAGDRGDIGRPLHAIRYDADADEIEIHVGQPAPRDAVLHYFVSSPRSIQVHEQVGGKVIAVDDASGVRTLIQVAHDADLMRYAAPLGRSVTSGSERDRLRR